MDKHTQCQPLALTHRQAGVYISPHTYAHTERNEKDERKERKEREEGREGDWVADRLNSFWIQRHWEVEILE